MRAAFLFALWLAACSSDWSLARQSGSIGAAGTSAGGAAALESAMVLCDRLPALSSEPAIDGQLEPGLSLYSWLDAAVDDLPPGMNVSVSLAYRPSALYFFAQVADATRDPAPANALTYCGDGIELYVDDDGVIQNPPGYDIPGTMQLIVAGPGDDTTPVRRGQRFIFPGTSSDSTDLGAWASTSFTAVPTATGYAIEALIVASDLGLDTWALAPGGKIGWNLSFNVGGPQAAGIDACTTRNQQIHFRFADSGTCTAPYCNASALCATTLGP